MPQPSAVRRPRDQTQSAEHPTNKPADKFTEGPVHVSIWENQGTNGAFRTASFEIRFRDDQQQWQTGRNYSSTALLHLEAAAREAHNRIEAWRRSNTPKPAPRR